MRGRWGLVVVLAFAACGGDGVAFDEDELREAIVREADDAVIAEEPELVDELVESIRDLCNENDDDRELQIAFSLDDDENPGAVLFWMDEACPSRIPARFVDDIPFDV